MGFLISDFGFWISSVIKASGNRVLLRWIYMKELADQLFSFFESGVEVVVYNNGVELRGKA